MTIVQPIRDERFDSIEDILSELSAGRMVIIMDDESRENEGDLIMAADRVRPEDINFMARYGRGLICMTMSRERCQQLRLPLMVSETDSDQRTNFTVSVEAAEGVTTGISAHDRAHTIQVAVARDAKPEDLRQPGHVFPLMSQPGGVLTRAGHTEAGCDLARLAGMEPAAVIVEILNEDGSMARRNDLETFARSHGLRIGSIADLIRYRLSKEQSVERIADRSVPTDFGEFQMYCYEDYVHHSVHLAMVCGEIDPAEPTLVRVHVQNTLADVAGLKWPSLGWPLRDAMQTVAEQGGGVVVILRPTEDPRELVGAVNRGNDTPDADDHTSELRTYGIGAQIIRDLGVRKMKVLSAPKIMHALSGFGLEVVEYVDGGS
ncbi:MAG: bifunctional 3,4-dihydroxy-2-butanone-4-phosphate synthase/GTP cyclohydrolase II [Gammaproteobacteria bacterium]|nr:bifunctional 3,4-dihydroxy-2-butanone-4-phosphate synthase/GTP cyclohydrolase II [Gammaproteobacteria bacterium]MDH3767306.1 bifunctional 3,4-dihydroxy-2-butanone-4-phosphate synthase/GTP cyclohydrolase II [Gammaproteobacteria bacterium]